MKEAKEEKEERGRGRERGENRRQEGMKAEGNEGRKKISDYL
jgi:hypothetical protein